MTKSAYETYQLFHALKQHFTTSYDYFKYNGRVNIKPETFKKRYDVHYYYNLSKKPKETRRDIILANLIYNENRWIEDVMSEDGDAIYREWARRVSGLEYNFKNELSRCKDDFQSNFRVCSGQHPHLMTMLVRGEISIETYTILSHATNIFSYWDKEISDPIVAKRINNKARKYKPFLTYDTKKYSKIIKQYFNI